MKRNVKLTITLLALGILFGYAATETNAQVRPKVGGYSEAEKTDAGVIAAANFAIKAQSEKTGMKFELAEIFKAERQVVAGTNYRLCMQVSADGDEAFYVQAVVYQDLKRNYKLTSWADSDCGDESPAPAPVPRVGGYSQIAKTDAGAVAAADYAIKAQSEKTGMKFALGELAKAERQVVAGTNFRLCIEVSADGDQAFYVQAVVYQDLKKNYKLTAWEDSDCGGQ